VETTEDNGEDMKVSELVQILITKYHPEASIMTLDEKGHGQHIISVQHTDSAIYLTQENCKLSLSNLEDSKILIPHIEWAYRDHEYEKF
jgi:hypothetical protein